MLSINNPVNTRTELLILFLLRVIGPGSSIFWPVFDPLEWQVGEGAGVGADIYFLN